MQQVRRDHRLPVKLPVTITVGQEPAEQHEAQLLDMSVHGMGLRTCRELAPGVQIQVQWDKFSFTGTIRHCKKQWKGYHSPYDNYRVGVLLWNPVDESDLDAIVSGSWRKSIFTRAEAIPEAGPSAA